MSPQHRQLARALTAVLAIAFLITPAFADGILCRGNARIGHYSDSINAINLDIVGDTAYVAGLISGFQILDISDPTNPTLLSTTLAEVNAINDVRVIDGIAYIAAGTSGLIVMDVSDPTQPTLLTEYALEAYTFLIDIEDGVAYLPTQYGPSLIHAVDISNPAQPSLISSLDTGLIRDIEVEDGILYLTDADNTFRTMDVSNPGAITEIGSVHTPNLHKNFVIADGVACIFGSSNGTSLLDVSDPSNMQWLDFENTPSNMGAYLPQLGRAYLLHSSDSLSVFNTTPAFNWESMGSIEITGNPYDVIIRDNLAYIASGGAGLLIMDISTPSGTPYLGEVALGSFANEIAISSHYAYVASDENGLSVVDFADPSNPALIAHIDTPEDTTDIAVHDGYVYVSDLSGLLIFDIQTPDQPEYVTTIPVPSVVTDFSIESDLAYITDLGAGLFIYDISDPSAPVQLSSLNVPNGAQGIAVDGTTVCINSGSETLIHFIDASMPEAPALVFSYEPESYIADMDTSDGILYAQLPGALLIFDISEPASTELINSLPLGSNAFPPHLDRIENTSLLMLSRSGVYIIDVADPESPTYVGSHHTSGSLPTAVSGSLLITGTSNGIRIYDLSDCPTCPGDLNGDSQLSYFDVAAFIESYIQQVHPADFNTDGLFNFFDVSAFLDAYAQGCP